MAVRNFLSPRLGSEITGMDEWQRKNGRAADLSVTSNGNHFKGHKAKLKGDDFTRSSIYSRQMSALPVTLSESRLQTHIRRAQDANVVLQYKSDSGQLQGWSW
jgi:hypothetical protein